jgi:hypothetical protein
MIPGRARNWIAVNASSTNRPQQKMKTNTITPLHLRKSIDCSPLRCGFLLLPLVLACFALLPPEAFGVLPAPDGGYANDNTAEGTNALFSLTTGAANTATGSKALYANTTGGQNTATGDHALRHNTTGYQNTAIGARALFNNSTGIQNAANGENALYFNTIGYSNTANGYFALGENTTGNANTASGYGALLRNKTGSNNIGLGHYAGEVLTTGSNNIDIGNPGVVAESNTIRIGQQANQTDTFIAGIHGQTITGSAVFINSAGRLGTVPSSQRFKDNITPIGKLSEALFALEPVTFQYKKELDPTGGSQFGLVAEQVAKVNPDLIARDKEGKPYSVRYEQVNAMLLNEFLKEHREVQELKKEVAALTAGLQKVSAQVEVGKPAPQVVNNR